MIECRCLKGRCPIHGKEKPQPKCFTPSVALLSKLGSILVHAEELVDPVKGHPFDKYALETVVKDPEVQEWRAEMAKLAFLPVRR